MRGRCARGDAAGTSGAATHAGGDVPAHPRTCANVASDASAPAAPSTANAPAAPCAASPPSSGAAPPPSSGPAPPPSSGAAPHPSSGPAPPPSSGPAAAPDAFLVAPPGAAAPGDSATSGAGAATPGVAPNGTPCAMDESPPKRQKVDDPTEGHTRGKWPPERSMHSMVTYKDRFLIVYGGISAQEDYMRDLVALFSLPFTLSFCFFMISHSRGAKFLQGRGLATKSYGLLLEPSVLVSNQSKRNRETKNFNIFVTSKFPVFPRNIAKIFPTVFAKIYRKVEIIQLFVIIPCQRVFK